MRLLPFVNNSEVHLLIYGSEPCRSIASNKSPMAQNESNADGLSALAEDESIEDEFNELLQSLHRVRKDDMRQKQHTVQELLRDSRKAVDAKAGEIYLQKEIAAALQSTKERLQPTAELDQTINHLQQCSINAAGVQFAVEQSVINAQLQGILQQQMRSAGDEPKPDLLEALSASHPALSLATLVSKQMAAVEEKKQLLRERRIELAHLHRSVTDLWQQKEQIDLTKKKRNDTEAMKTKREKLHMKEGRIALLVHLLQSLMTGLSPSWGTDAQCLNVLKACEFYTNSRQAVDLDHLRSLLDMGESSDSSE